MAEETNSQVQIDELTLQINVKGATATQTKKINEFSKALENLNNALSESLLNRIEKLNKLSLNFGTISKIGKIIPSQNNLKMVYQFHEKLQINQQILILAIIMLMLVVL